MEMEQNVAQALLTEGATLVLLDVPVGTDVGIDIKSWNAGQNFKGIKMIPPGIHFVHYSAVNKFGDSTPRVGFFHDFQKSEFLVKRWDKDKEDISSEDAPEEVVQRLKDNIKELDRYLGPYPYEILKPWTKLTNGITASLVARCSPLCGYVRSALELEHCSDASRPRGGESDSKRRRSGRLTVEDREEQLLPDLKPRPGTELRLTEISDKRYPDDATPSEITRHSLDSSYVLDTTLKKLREPIEIIGEMQLTFICFLAGQSLDAFEQWKKLVSLICDVDNAIPQYHSIYMEFLQALEVELSYVPEEVLCDIVASNNFVYRSLCNLFGNIESNFEVDGRLKSYAKRLQSRLTAKFLWDFSNLLEEMDDEAPVVVTLA
ncbi:PREDICTED: protein AAR2 homolog isoform X2 [Wasmannia auropunctata]|uniref:protein AAR2 homolog isoform X2 n=1 Tax=Wasmannia auropunctata TaxID=64793 RepID=UPI0005EF48FC|nr:PREDICTED: protein AAR2 homolog isoform X2 [Wasmannia auropunctata]